MAQTYYAGEIYFIIRESENRDICNNLVVRIVDNLSPSLTMVIIKSKIPRIKIIQGFTENLHHQFHHPNDEGITSNFAYKHKDSGK
jgi:hypothetical protein